MEKESGRVGAENLAVQDLNAACVFKLMLASISLRT